MADETIHRHINDRPDSITIGTPSKGGEVKVYFNATMPAQEIKNLIDQTPASGALPLPTLHQNPIPQIKEVTIACTINLDSYENFRLEVTGTSAEACKAYIIDTLKDYGTKSPATKERIDRYVLRVFGGA